MKGERVGAGGWGWPRGLVRVTGRGGGGGVGPKIPTRKSTHTLGYRNGSKLR